MAEHLTQEWLDERVAAAASLAAEPGVDMTVRVSVTGKPGDVVWLERWDAGRLVSAELLGSVDDVADDQVDLDVTTTRKDAAALVDGTFDEAAAYMLGRLKVAGPMSTWLDLQRVLQGEGWRSITRSAG